MRNLKQFYEYLFPTVIGCLILNVAFINLPVFWANLFIGKTNFSITPSFQDIMWAIFILGVLIIRGRVKEIQVLNSFDHTDYLPGGFEEIVDTIVLTEIIKKSKDDAKKEMGVLPYMIFQIALQFRTNKSISLTSDFLSKQLDLFLHSVELRYNKLKYIIWLIPSIGFMGTVYGIGVAVAQLGSGSIDDPELLTKMAGSLGVAFNTTLLALILSVVLQYFTQHYEAKEEGVINSYGKNILENLINKLVER